MTEISLHEDIDEKEATTPKERGERTSWMAWIETAVCVGVNMSCAFMWGTGSSVPILMSAWMKVNLTQVNWLSNASAICNTLFSLTTAWAYEKLGIKTSIIVCAVLNTVGCWIRCLAIILPSDQRYIVMLIGQFIASIGGPLIYKLVKNIYIHEKRKECYLIIVATISTIFTIPAFFIPSQPRIPPSASALVERTALWEGIREIARNRQFWWITIIGSVSMGMPGAVSVLIIEAIAPYGYSEQQAGLGAAIIVFSGCVGGVIPNAYAVVLIACILNGFFSYALFPVYLELASEITYPVSESVCSCVLWTLSSLMMVVFSLVIDTLRAGPDASPPNNMNLSLIVVSVVMLVGNLPCLWLQGELKRSNVDTQQKLHV
ncbi:MAG: major facilitator superfamily domain-containing protein [Benjaminiella poitrasii]|nr:MAG: major facilitator superfamily domain-containing protein [Benjaminiella poitrasii]